MVQDGTEHGGKATEMACPEVTLPWAHHCTVNTTGARYDFDRIDRFYPSTDACNGSGGIYLAGHFFCLTGLLNPKSSEFLLFFFGAAVLRLLTLPVILAVNDFGDTAVSSNGPVLVS